VLLLMGLETPEGFSPREPSKRGDTQANSGMTRSRT
jgi:hypothetical protein